MTWQEYKLSAQLMAEETYGKAARVARREEDEVFARSMRAYQKMSR